MVKHRAASVGCAIAHKKRALPGVADRTGREKNTNHMFLRTVYHFRGGKASNK
nr:MAG TPA: hypothetical protein [Caudoviricetes sp.]